MRVLIDENMTSRRLAAQLQSAGHDVVLTTNVGLVSVGDARVSALRSCLAVAISTWRR